MIIEKDEMGIQDSYFQSECQECVVLHDGCAGIATIPMKIYILGNTGEDTLSHEQW